MADKILVVEDEQPVRAFIRTVLAQDGYEILEAGNGEEALDVWRSHRDGIRVVLTDVVMPKMGGPELALRIKESVPGIAVVFMSGYSDEPLFERAGELVYRFLPKPFTPMALTEAIRDALNSLG